MIELPDIEKRRKIKNTLIIITLATIPCYLIGLIIVWVGSTVKNRATVTPTVYFVPTDTPVFLSPTLPQPSAVFESPTITPSPTQGPTPTPSATYFIPSSTPTATATASATATQTSTITPTPTVVLTTDTPIPEPPL